MQQHLAILGTDTGVGKTTVTAALCLALRRRGKRVWLHKPVACGGWQDGLAEDVRRLLPLLGDGQPTASLCRHQWPAGCSPHLAARRSGDHVSAAELLQPPEREALLADDHHLLVEGTGGVAVPLSADDTQIGDLCRAWDLSGLLVCRPDLGTLNHTRLSLHYLQQCGVSVAGLVICRSRPHDPEDPALAGIDKELQDLTGMPVLADFTFGKRHQAAAETLAAALFGPA